jgi:hypothetical protein
MPLPWPDIAAQVDQHLGLLGCLDAFGDDGAAEGLRQADDPFDDRHVLLVVEHVVHERAVDLEQVQRQALQVGEGRVAGAEVVERELDAERAALLHQLAGVVDVGQRCGFEHLDDQALRDRRAVAAQA